MCGHHFDGHYDTSLQAGSPYGDLTYGEVIPEHTIYSIHQYAQHGQLPGRFLMAVLDSNLFVAISRADDGNLYALVAIVRYLQNRVPGGCLGSQERVFEWCKTHRE